MAFRSKTETCNLCGLEIEKIKKLGYIINLSQLEKEIGIKSQALRICFSSGRCTQVCKELEKIEEFIKRVFNFK